MERDEYEKRLVPMSDDEIIAVTRAMKDTPEIWAIFPRVGLDGDMSYEEESMVEAFTDSYRKSHGLWDRDPLHMLLASAILRRLAAGLFCGVDDEAVLEFIARNRVKRAGRGVVPINATVDEVIGLAKAYRNNLTVWCGYQEMVASGAEQLAPVPFREKNLIRHNYVKKHCLFNRGGLAQTGDLLAHLVREKIKSIDDEQTRELIASWRDVDRE